MGRSPGAVTWVHCPPGRGGGAIPVSSAVQMRLDRILTLAPNQDTERGGGRRPGSEAPGGGVAGREASGAPDHGLRSPPTPRAGSALRSSTRMAGDLGAGFRGAPGFVGAADSLLPQFWVLRPRHQRATLLVYVSIDAHTQADGAQCSHRPALPATPWATACHSAWGALCAPMTRLPTPALLRPLSPRRMKPSLAFWEC